MTRTERSVFPKAIARDRSESKSGMDKSLRKHGAGTHNWGSLNDEVDLEFGAMLDEEDEIGVTTGKDKPVLERRTSSATDEERDNAREFRRRALSKDGIDLAAIARTSSAVATFTLKDSPTETSQEISV